MILSKEHFFNQRSYNAYLYLSENINKINKFISHPQFIVIFNESFVVNDNVYLNDNYSLFINDKFFDLISYKNSLLYITKQSISEFFQQFMIVHRDYTQHIKL